MNGWVDAVLASQGADELEEPAAESIIERVDVSDTLHDGFDDRARGSDYSVRCQFFVFFCLFSFDCGRAIHVVSARVVVHVYRQAAVARCSQTVVKRA